MGQVSPGCSTAFVVADVIDPLPDADLHNVLHEFTERLPIDMGELIPLRPDELKYESRPSAVRVKWVLGYTVMSQSRNVVQDKG